MQFIEPCFYVPGRAGIVDTCYIDDASGVLRGTYSHETQEEINARYPGVTVGELATVARDSANSFKAAPVRITKARYYEMLEVLPPHDWQGTGSHAESFKLCERTYGPVTAIFARIGESYFEMADDIRTAHDWIIARIRETFPMRYVVQAYCTGLGWADSNYGGATMAEARAMRDALVANSDAWVNADLPRQTRIIDKHA